MANYCDNTHLGMTTTTKETFLVYFPEIFSQAFVRWKELIHGKNNSAIFQFLSQDREYDRSLEINNNRIPVIYRISRLSILKYDRSLVRKHLQM